VTLFIKERKGSGWTSESIRNSPDYDPRLDTPFGRYRVRTPSATSMRKEFGTYQINGKSIDFDFPAYTISATIYGNSIKGFLTHKNSDKEEEWIISKAPDENGRKASRPDNENGKLIEESTFAVAADTPILSKWKCLEHSDTGTVSKIIIVTYFQSGDSEITFQNTNERRKWRYTSKTATSGVEEDYVRGELVERDNIRWITNNQFEVTIVFFAEPSQVGTKQICTRQ
jgi:hypothetical protein